MKHLMWSSVSCAASSTDECPVAQYTPPATASTSAAAAASADMRRHPHACRHGAALAKPRSPRLQAGRRRLAQRHPAARKQGTHLALLLGRPPAVGAPLEMRGDHGRVAGRGLAVHERGQERLHLATVGALGGKLQHHAWPSVPVRRSRAPARAVSAAVQQLPAARNARHHGANRHRQRVGDLLVGQILHVAQPDGLAKGLGQRVDGGPDVGVAQIAQQHGFRRRSGRPRRRLRHRQPRQRSRCRTTPAPARRRGADCATCCEGWYRARPSGWCPARTARARGAPSNRCPAPDRARRRRRGSA